MRLPHFHFRHASIGLAILAAPVLAATPMDLSIIDRAVADFTGAAQGQPGGARLPVDRRLRPDPCDGPLNLSWFGRDQRSVQVACPQRGWKIYVAVDGASSAPVYGNRQARSASGQTLVNRGEGVTILARGRGFTLTRQGEALEAGAQGDWIKIRPVGDKKATLRAQVLRPGQVGMELP